MNNKEIANWTDFWRIFDGLIDSLTQRGQLHIVSSLKHAQKYVNGYTDGWYDFITAFGNVFNENKYSLTQEQLHMALMLIDYLRSCFPNFSVED